MLDRRVFPPARSDRGLTLIELLVTLTIVAVLLAVGVPNLRSYFITNGLATTTNELHAALNLARSEAVRRSVAVTIRRTSATTRNWSDGWEIFVDDDGDGTKDATETVVIQKHGLVPDRLTVYANATAADFLTFGIQGQSTGGVLVICYDGQLTADGESRSRALMVSSSGRVRMGTDSDNDNIPESDNGADIDSCTNPSNDSGT
ncbi:MAG TPA: GspH/FimT family pseudopilin [Burkholderiaceae bacterium]|nr:GspH/FimT family pseudopilin [Burkholderiaceae bacterium]